jgi:iron complex outermembrane receptor protein
VELIFCIWLGLVMTTGAVPQNEEPVELDPITVVGKREPVRLSRAVNSVITVSPEKISAAGEDNILAHISNSHAAITIPSVNSAGYGLGQRGQGKLQIRGLGFSPNSGSLVLIDGRPDIAGLFGHPLPDTYGRAGLYSAELIKGGASTLYGSNAIAGVLDLHSFYRPDVNRYTNIELRGGSYNTANGIVQHSQKIGKTIVAGWYEYIESDNHRENSKYANRSGGLRMQWNKNAHLNGFIAARYTSFHYADAGPLYNLSYYAGDVVRTGITAGLDYSTRRHSLYVRAYNSYGDHSFTDGFNSIDRNNGITLFGKLHNSGIRNVSLSGGLSFNSLGGLADNGSPFINAGNFSEHESTAHLQIEYDIAEIAELTLGGRYIIHDRYNGHFVYQTGAVITPSSLGSLKLSLGTAYRNPTVNESQLFMISNPDSLGPEEGTFYEIGYFNTFTDYLSVESAVFWNNGKNVIVTRPNPQAPPPVRYQNAAQYNHSGWEMTMRYSYGSWLITPSFTHLNQHEFNLSVPGDKLVMSTTFHHKVFRLSTESIAAYNIQSDSAGMPVELDDYFVTNITGSYSITDNVKVNLRVENIFDRDYQIVHGYPMAGITVRGGVAVSMQ